MIDEEELKNLPTQSEQIAFRVEEMILCRTCARKNPPNRLNCVYCGADLELSDAQTANLKIPRRKPENWEKGFNLIYLQGSPDNETLAGIAKKTQLDKTFLSQIFTSRTKLPIMRVESLREGEILQKIFQTAGIETLIVSDESLKPETLPKRLRKLEFTDEKLILTLFGNDQSIELLPEDIAVIVSGAIFQKTVESTETRKKGKNKILDASETASDELVFDFYVKSEPTGFRVLTRGFDFSCLGAEKKRLARENLPKLILKLQNFAPQAKFVNDYLAMRGILGEVWEVEQRTDPQGLKRHSFGKFDFSRISSSNNEMQFTKYSRLQWHLL